MGEHDATLSLAHDLADLADALTLPAFRGRPEVELKDDGTPVTAVDRAVERRLRRELSARRPHDAVLGEEDGLDGGADAPRWIIDPIDGTKNFVAGVPVFATLIALQLDGDEVLGVVSAPALGVRWDGVVGVGARRDGVPVRVSTTAELSGAAISFGGLRYFNERGLGGLVPALTAATARQRGFGDFWHHCLVAAGGLDLAVEAAVSEWDLAAVRAVVRAAGGRLTSLDGRETAAGGDVLTSNGRLHAAALELVADAG